MQPTKEKRVMADFKLDKLSKVIVKQHTHPLPVCKANTHSPTCVKFGHELSCVRIIVGFDKATLKPKYGAFCTHMYF
jgi:hypothetical protein